MIQTQTMATEQKVYEKADLVRQLRSMGIEDGDTLVARVGLRSMGPLRKPGDRTLLESFQEALGSRGTLLVYTHSPVQWIFRRDRTYVFDPATAPSITGRFAQLVLETEGAYRSAHPTASMTALGRHARDILHDHDHEATSFAPFKHLIDLGAKQILIGCAYTDPGYGTPHYVYEQLGLADHSLLSGLRGCYIRKGSEVVWFKQRDVPGCSRGFHRFYPLYDEKSALISGKVGDAESFLTRTGDAYQVELEAVKKSLTISLCEHADCYECRATKLFNLREMIPYLLLCAPRKVFKRIARVWR
jgi:aminoglycoside 3-N-acetyltransferase